MIKIKVKKYCHGPEVGSPLSSFVVARKERLRKKNLSSSFLIGLAGWMEASAVLGEEGEVAGREGKQKEEEEFGLAARASEGP